MRPTADLVPSRPNTPVAFRCPEGMSYCHLTEPAEEEKRIGARGGDSGACNRKSDSGTNEPVIRGSWQSWADRMLMKSRF